MSTPQQPNGQQPYGNEPNGQQPNERIVYVEKKKKGGCMKWGLIIVGVLIVLGIIASLTGGGDDSSNTSDGSSATSAPADAGSEEQPAEDNAEASEAIEEEPTTDFGVGETYTTSNGLDITVDSMAFASDALGGSYVGVTVTYTNNGDEQQSFNPYDWKLQSPAGLISDPTIAGLDQLSYGDLAPGGTASGTIYFDAGDSGEYTAVWEPTFSFSGDNATWNAAL